MSMGKRESRVRLSQLLMAVPLAIVVGVFAGGAQVMAADLHVGAGHPYATIQLAIDAAVTGNVVRVHAGVYTENIVWNTKNIKVKGDDPSTCIVDGGGVGRVFSISNTPAGAELTGLTIRNGGPTPGHLPGAGLFLSTCSMVLTDLVVTGNTASATGSGGGMGTQFCDLTVTSCLFQDNVADAAGGGVYLNMGTAVFSDCQFLGNAASWWGGGIAGNPTSVQFTDCTIRSNSVSDNSGGGGLYLSDSAVTIAGCVLEQNNATGGPGGGLRTRLGSVSVTDSSFTGNQAASFGGGAYMRKPAALTVTGCDFASNGAAGGDGGGLRYAECTAAVSGCTFTANTSSGRGAGLTASQAASTITGCSFIGNNSSSIGGGVLIELGNASLTRCTVAENHAVNFGGGVAALLTTALDISRNVISDNTSDGAAGGIFLSGCPGSTVTGDLIVMNEAGSGGGIWATSGDGTVYAGNTIAHNTGGGMTDSSAGIVVKDSIVSGNGNWDLSVPDATVSYSCVGDGNATGTGVFSVDPQFANPANHDFHLKSAFGRFDPGSASWVTDPTLEHSPGINNGDPTSDRSSEPDPASGPVNMGYHGNTPEASKHGNVAPTTPVVEIVPANPGTNDDIVLNIITPSYDANMDPITYSYGWFKDSDFQAAVTDLTTIPAATTAAGNDWVCIAIVADNLAPPNDGASDRVHISGDIQVPADYPTIQAGIDAAEDGDRVIVGPGTYPENVVWDAKDIDVLGAGPATCIVDGGGVGRVFDISNTPATAELAGFTLRNGAVPVDAPRGAGMILLYSSLAITDVVFTGNAMAVQGGVGAGLFSDRSDPTLTSCVFRGNVCDGQGGGCYVNGGNLQFIGCEFVDNTSTSWGAGLGGVAESVQLIDCTISSNTSNGGGGGGGVHLVWTDLTVTGCVFDQNSALNGNGGGLNTDGAFLSIVDTSFTGNVAGKSGGLVAGNMDTGTLTRVTCSGNEATNGSGGTGLYSAASLTVTDCDFVGNTTAEGDAGGLLYWEGNATITGCNFTGNEAGRDGGGVYAIYATNLNFVGNVIANNVCSASGGGMRVINCPDATIAGNRVVKNQGQPRNSGIVTDVSDGITYSGNTIAHNASGGILDSSSDVTVANSILWGNGTDLLALDATVSYSCVGVSEGNFKGAGIFSADPMFADVAGDDFRLKSAFGRWDPGSAAFVTDATAEHSPCIDNGDPAVDFSGEPDSGRGRLNMGCFGNTAEASKGGNVAPLAPLVDVTPDQPLTADDLVVTVTDPSYDPNADPVTYSYRWSADGVPRPDFDDQTTVPASATTKGETWTCVVTPNDGQADGALGDDQVVVGNTAPTPPDACAVAPGEPTSADDLTATATGATDEDADSLSYEYQWRSSTDNGATWTAWGDDGQVLGSARTSTLQLWQACARSLDGIANSPWFEGDTVQVYDRLTYDFAAGIHLAAVPFAPSDPAPDVVFPGCEIAGDWNGTDYTDPAAIELSRGYWISRAEAWELSARGALVTNGRAEASFAGAGWHMAGNPFLMPLEWANVSAPGLVPYGWIYDERTAAYQLVADLDGLNVRREVLPWYGFWVNLQNPATDLQMQAGAALAQVAPLSVAPSDPGDWLMRLVASAPGSVDADNWVGVLGSQELTIPNPPAPAGAYVDLFVVGDDDGRNALSVSPAAAGAAQWDVVVQTNIGNAPIAVEYPDLSMVPADYSLTLVDLDTGARQYMRTTTRYEFTSGAQGATRHLRIEVTPRSANTPMVTSLSARQGSGGVVVTYSLSAPASVDAVLLNIAGRVVKRLQSDTLSPAGASNVVWNLSADSGTPVPGGAYLCRVTARSDSGQLTNMIVPVQVSR